MSTTTDTPTLRPTRRRSGIGWPIAVSVILGGTVALNLWVMRLASSDPSFAVEQDYYHKAVAFDSTVAHERASAALGWQLESRVDGTRALAVTLADRHGVPIRGARVTVEAFAVARSAHVLTDTLAAGTDGRYVARARLDQAGLWELRFAAREGGRTFTTVRRVDVAPRPGG